MLERGALVDAEDRPVGLRGGDLGLLHEGNRGEVVDAADVGGSEAGGVELGAVVRACLVLVRDLIDKTPVLQAASRGWRQRLDLLVPEAPIGHVDSFAHRVLAAQPGPVTGTSAG